MLRGVLIDSIELVLSKASSSAPMDWHAPSTSSSTTPMDAFAHSTSSSITPMETFALPTPSSTGTLFFGFAQPIPTVEYLEALLAVLKIKSESPYLEHNELVHLIFALTLTFHNNLEHAALSMLVDKSYLQREDDNFGLLRPFIHLMQAGLLDYYTISRLLAFIELDETKFPTLPSTQIVNALASQELLSPDAFHMIFSDSIYHSYQQGGVEPHSALARVYLGLPKLPLAKLNALSLDEEKTIATDNIIHRLRLRGLFTSEVRKVLTKEIDFAVSIDKTLTGILDLCLYPSCLPNMIRAAKYEANDRFDIGLIELVACYKKSHYLNEDSLQKLLQLILQSHGLIKRLVYFLTEHHESSSSLLTEDNINQLPNVLFFLPFVHAAFAALDYKDSLTQDRFDAIIRQPLDALFITASILGKKSFFQLTDDEEFNTHWPLAVHTIRTFIEDTINKSRIYKKVEEVVTQSDSSQFRWTLPRINSLRNFVSTYKPSSTGKFLKFDDEIEISANYFMALAETFQYSRDHEAFNKLVHPNDLPMIDAFIVLYRKNLFTVHNARQLLKFLRLDQIANYPLRSAAIVIDSEEFLSQNVFDVIFSDVNYQFSCQSKPMHILMARLYHVFREIISIDQYQALSKQPEQAHAALKLIQSLNGLNLMTLEVKQALAEVIEYCDSIAEVLTFLERNDLLLAQNQANVAANILAAIRTAKYHSEQQGAISLMDILEIYYETTFLDQETLEQLFNAVMLSQGNIKGFIWFLPGIDNEESIGHDLLTVENIDKLCEIQVLKYHRSVHAALSVLCYFDKLDSIQFYHIVNYPSQAIKIAFQRIGSANVQDAIYNALSEEPFWSQAVATLKSAIGISNASRFFYGPLIRHQGSNKQLYPVDDSLKQICFDTVESCSLEPDVATDLFNKCKGKR